MNDTPIFITSRDRCNFLRKLIDRLELANMTNIIVVDTGSTYPPILDYYETLPHKLIRLGNVERLPQRAIWEQGLLKELGLQQSWFVLTDSDVVPTEDCPNDFLEVMYDALQRFPKMDKAGFGLKIDDIPDHYQHKHALPGVNVHQHPGVLEWEPGFWRDELAPGLYSAPIDTTFALYRPGMGWGTWQPSIRTGPPYLARHLAWYCNSANPTEEELYYKAHVVPEVSSWGL
jgi:hypothetical protein